MGADPGAVLLTRRQTEGLSAHDADKVRRDFIDFYNVMMANPYLAAEKGYIDAVIEPSQTRLELRKALAQLRDKRVPRTPRKNYLMPI